MSNFVRIPRRLAVEPLEDILDSLCQLESA